MKPVTLDSLASLASLNADTIIDVRAPSEFAEDHLPGAINLPVLNDAERAEVGTIYARQSPFAARKIGGALVASNTAQHLRTTLADKPGEWQPLVYCWRGGQRSGAFATILDQVGWRVSLLQGGYRSYRRLVVASLYDQPLPHRLMLIDGGTGTAKTALLAHLAEAGAQVLDLEALAAHRGSLFGAVSDTQPSQKMFESQLAAALTALDPNRITWVEAESSKIGQRILPPMLWTAMTQAPRLHLSAPLAARARYLTQAYADLTGDTERLARQIDQLRPYHSADRLAQWHAQAQNHDWTALAESLMSAHYDPRYAKSSAQKPAPVAEYTLKDLSPDTLAETARQIITEMA